MTAAFALADDAAVDDVAVATAPVERPRGTMPARPDPRDEVAEALGEQGAHRAVLTGRGRRAANRPDAGARILEHWAAA